MFKVKQGSTSPFFGEGDLRIPCRFCLNDDTYKADELIPMDVEEENTRPERLHASGRYRGSLSKDYPGIRPTFGANLIEHRPEAAKVMARCMSLAVEVEALCANLLSVFVGTDSPAAVQMFLAIRSGRHQFDAILAAAQVSLDERDLSLFKALMHLKDGLDRQRNLLAHGHFGIATAIPRGLCWMSVEDRSKSLHLKEAGTVEAQIAKTYVYEPEDLETIAQETEELTGNMVQFMAYLGWPKDARRDERYRQLCAAPDVAKALFHLDDRENNRAKNRERQAAKMNVK